MNPSQATVEPADEEADHLKAVEFCRTACASVQSELGKVVVGQTDVIQEILIAIFTRSHAILVGVPGLAKTLMISTLAQTLQMSFKRIQFTPDLMPSDITGTEVIYSDQTTGEKQFKFLPGPIFANIVLADEINRTPPKTQHGEGAVPRLGAEEQIHRPGDHRMIPRQKPHIFPAQRTPAVAGGDHAFGWHSGKGIGGDAVRT